VHNPDPSLKFHENSDVYQEVIMALGAGAARDGRRGAVAEAIMDQRGEKPEIPQAVQVPSQLTDS
jgi:hypothetical protein